MTVPDVFVKGGRGRRSIRLPGYDYSRSGAYFMTLVTQHRFCAFGAIVDGVMNLNPIGRMVRDTWNEVPGHYPGIGIDAFVVMPNHAHGIIVLRDEPPAVTVGAGPRACPNGSATAGPRACPDRFPRGCPNGSATANSRFSDSGFGGQPRGVAPTGAANQSGTHGGVPLQTIPSKRLSLPDVVHRFKSLTTARYIAGVKQYAWPEFPGHFWQRNYHEHIIRDDAELNRIRDYIANNPAQWDRDRFHIAPPRQGERQCV
jgi:REP element-mobilizing transposase RayT